MTISTETDSTAIELDGQLAPQAFSNADLQALALEAGIPNSTWSFPPELRVFADLIVERCASIGDKYSAVDSDANAGEEIRAAFGLG